MSEHAADLDVDALRRDIHGERVATDHACDYCGANFDIDQPVLYEVIRVTDMPNLTALLDLPDGWIPDAARCRQCDRDTLAPATEGFDEALVRIDINDATTVLSIDAASLTVADVSPADAGYFPPYIAPRLVMQYADPGLVRWLRVQQLLELDEQLQDTIIGTIVEHSPDVPPNLQ